MIDWKGRQYNLINIHTVNSSDPKYLTRSTQSSLLTLEGGFSSLISFVSYLQ